MNSTELSQLSRSELKSIAQDKGIKVTGDRRSKAAYILAIETFQSEPTVIETLPAIPDPFEGATEVYQPIDLMEAAKMASTAPIAESIVQPTPLAIPPTTQHRQASIVMLAPLILLSVAVIAIRISISVLIPTIAAVGRLLVAVWRSIPRKIDTNSIPINYFPA